jgi:hypothetical protein
MSRNTESYNKVKKIRKKHAKASLQYSWTSAIFVDI